MFSHFQVIRVSDKHTLNSTGLIFDNFWDSTSTAVSDQLFSESKQNTARKTKKITSKI